MSAISPQCILDETKFRTIKTQNVVVLNDDQIDTLNLSLANNSSRILLWISVVNLGQIDQNASEKLKISDSTNTYFDVPLNNSNLAFDVPVESINSFNTNTLELEVTSTGQRSTLLGPWVVVVHYT